jgi:DNA-binding winged helix-turn-helix (wHTH) protein
MAQGFSKENQSSVEPAYRFGDFELNAAERSLTKAGKPVPMQPKAFDALLCLVRRAERLVSKQELLKILWPSVHVTDANLTNTIVSLRKIVGREAIRTVSKHGYRFELAVTGEPGVAKATYEKFARAKELTVQRSAASMELARDLYWSCIAYDPGFAPAWAWLGRCCWFFNKFGDSHSGNTELTRSVFERAFKLDPDLAAAHQFYTLFEVDTGHAEQATRRLLDRLKLHPGEPESLSGLVQALRFRGLLDQSLEAHRRAVEMDPAVSTSVAHTLFLAGEYGSAIQAYRGRGAYYLDAAAWAALGETEQAASLLRERLDKMSLSKLMAALMRSLLELLDGRSEEAARLMEAADTSGDPEILVYFARHYSRMGFADEAVDLLKRAVQLGFVCSPHTLQSDLWLGNVREHPEFVSFSHTAEVLVEQAQGSFEDSKG